VREPAYTRLDVDERRRQLLELGARLFTSHRYSELSMARIAAEAGISKALLYHYFPSKQDFFRATLAQAADELQERIAPDPGLAAAQQLDASLDAFLGWVETHGQAYEKLLRTSLEVDEVRLLVEEQREAFAARILAGLDTSGAASRAAVRGWLWSIDGVCLDWIGHQDLSRAQVREILRGTLVGALGAAAAT
jgi:AcrR family transcriptional regulator